MQVLGSRRDPVTVKLRPVTGTRTFEAGLILAGARSDLVYALSTDRVLVTIGGSLADLDRLSGAAPLVAPGRRDQSRGPGTPYAPVRDISEPGSRTHPAPGRRPISRR